MTHSLATVAIPFDAACADAVERAVCKDLVPLGNSFTVPPEKRFTSPFAVDPGAPPSDLLRHTLWCTGVVHFMSISVIPNEGGSEAHFLMEVSADGPADEALRAVAGALGPKLDALLAAMCRNFGGMDAAEILIRHNRQIVQAWQWPGWLRLGFRQRQRTALGLPFDGSPDMSVQRIRREAELAYHIGRMPALTEPGSAHERLERVREALWSKEPAPWAEGDRKWAFTEESAPMLDPPPPDPGDGLMYWLRVFAAGWQLLLWPLIPLPVLLWLLLWHLGAGWLGAILLSLALSAVGLFSAGLAGVRYLHRLEATEPVQDATPNSARNGEIMAQEGIYAQGLLASVSTVKSGWFRMLTLRLAFAVIVVSVPIKSQPGYLGRMGVIHFARWFVLPGTRRLLFYSNYDGAWESYVEDFIQIEHDGVTSIWTNTEGFPLTRDLFHEGSQDGDRLRRWARNQQFPPLFWFAGYPTLTLSRIRINAAIRRGLSTARTDDDAEAWLANFGIAPRARGILDKPEIPTLVFGGRRHMRIGRCLALRLAEDPGECRAWLAAIEHDITYGEDRARRSAVVLGLAAPGLRKLGLPESDLSTFPAVFCQGMTAPWRSRALGDDPDAWEWGYGEGTADAVLLLYAETDVDLADVGQQMLAAARIHGLRPVADIRMADLPTDRGAPVVEPFGFVDGISQPIIEDTPRARSRRDTDHLVAPGEFVLGYPDNAGYFPPVPSVHPTHDIHHRLADRSPGASGQNRFRAGSGTPGRHDLGRNGTYLVIRQIEQDVVAFETWLAGHANRDWAAAQLVGRWRNGAPLVRHPERPPQGRAHYHNDFRFGAEDPDGLRCPLGAHIRRANPRDGLDPTAPGAVQIVNRHRLLRVGRPYVAPPAGPADPGGPSRRGTLFMCLNADIERQFEFIQQTWLRGRSFAGLEQETDPIAGTTDGEERIFTVPTRDGRHVHRNLPDFVAVRGGGYFFMPARRTVRYLARLGVRRKASRRGAI